MNGPEPTTQAQTRAQIALTGATGCIGRVLHQGLTRRGHDVTPLARSLGTDFGNPDHLARAFDGRDAVIHLAWGYAQNPQTAAASYSANLELNRTVLHAARDAEVPRVLMASSVHADYFYDHTGDDLISPQRDPRGNGPYGCAKVIAEQDAQAVAKTGLDVVCLRYGAVTTDNQPHPTDPWEQRVFLDHEDLLNLIEAILRSPVEPTRCTTLYAVSDNPGRVHDTINPFDWQPPN
ncbi:MAG: NAD(P)-dependent oxidoreductase, partial [Planctomycetota bacterium]